MNRRMFLKGLAAAGMSAFAPSLTSLRGLYPAAHAMVDYQGVSVIAPSVMPQVINIFLYGGPSELSGNLTNIVEINDNSQNSYTGRFGNEILQNDVDGTGNNGLITRNGFWRGAGGTHMQYMLDQGMMSVYRTIHKVKNPTRSHRESVLMGLKGSLDVDFGAGVGTRIAAMMLENRSAYETGSTALADGTIISDITDVTSLPLPYVSLEGETRAFQQDPDINLPLALRYLTLSEDFDNPYARNNNGDGPALELIADTVRDQAYLDRYRGVADAFSNRETMEDNIGSLTGGANPVSRTTDSSGNFLPSLSNTDTIVTDNPDFFEDQMDGTSRLRYPDRNQNRYADRIRAAVTLALENPSTMYISVGGGLGGWDDHNNGVDRYPDRMEDLFETLRVAMLHIQLSAGTTPGGRTRTTDNIIINMFGDFGRRVNLNNSQGWDHGNNQNLWTFGGAGIRGAGALGKVVGKTARVGESGTNNQVTEPTSDSYQAEPMSIASSVYSYFGVQNPELLTADAEFNPDGDPPLDETVPGEMALF